MTKVIGFIPSYNAKHTEIISAFIEGIPGAELQPLAKYKPCDVAVIFGGVKNAYPPTYPKGPIMARHEGRSLIMIESAFQKRGEYYAIGWGGAAGNADFNTANVRSLDRFNNMQIRTKPPRRNPDGPVIIAGQLPRDVQVQDVNHIKWVRETFDFYKQAGIPALVRPHPKVDDPSIYGVHPNDLNFASLETTLEMARCVVTWNSTTGVDAILAGVPTIALNRGSMVYEFAEHSLESIDALRDRRLLLSRIGYAQWTIGEMRRGSPWRHLTAEYRKGTGGF